MAIRAFCTLKGHRPDPTNRARLEISLRVSVIGNQRGTLQKEIEMITASVDPDTANLAQIVPQRVQQYLEGRGVTFAPTDTVLFR